MDLARIIVLSKSQPKNKPQRGAKAKFCPGKGFKREKGDAVLTGDPLVTFKGFRPGS